MTVLDDTVGMLLYVVGEMAVTRKLDTEFFAPVLLLVSPWPALTNVLWVVIAVTGLWLGLLGVAMATGLAMVLRSGTELSDDYWQSLLDYPDGPKVTARQLISR